MERLEKHIEVQSKHSPCLPMLVTIRHESTMLRDPAPNGDYLNLWRFLRIVATQSNFHDFFFLSREARDPYSF
jgi:hypothetical protein